MLLNRQRSYCKVLFRPSHLVRTLTTIKHSEALLTATEAIKLSTASNIQFVDGSWYMDANRHPDKEYVDQVIP